MRRACRVLLRSECVLGGGGGGGGGSGVACAREEGHGGWDGMLAVGMETGPVTEKKTIRTIGNLATFLRLIHCKCVHLLLYFIILLFITLLFIILLLCLCCWYFEQTLAQEFPLGLIKFYLILFYLLRVSQDVSE